MKNIGIKKVVREDLPETNSSSSHSVVISMKTENNLKREDWNLNIDENLILHIPSFIDFGREFFSSNDVLFKLQYLSCFFITGSYRNKILMSKLIHKFEITLKDILGIKGISFDNAVDVWRAIHNSELPEDMDLEFPIIDWQSKDLRYEILESPETIKNFLLNPDSWVYGGDDGDIFDLRRFPNTVLQSTVIGVISVDLVGIGIVDIELTTDNYCLEDYIHWNRNDAILDYIIFDKNLNKFVIDNNHRDFTDYLNNTDLLFFSRITEYNVIEFKNSKEVLNINGTITIFDVSKFSI